MTLAETLDREAAGHEAAAKIGPMTLGGCYVVNEEDHALSSPHSGPGPTRCLDEAEIHHPVIEAMLRMRG